MCVFIDTTQIRRVDYGLPEPDALAPQPSASPTFKLLAILEVEIRDALWQVLDIP